MKNKKGFTLIELLAIIVILVIITVITVPIVLNIIDNSKKGAVTIEGSKFNEKMKKLAGDTNTTSPAENTTITAFKHSETAPDMNSMTSDNIVTQEGSKYPLYI